MRFAQGLFGLSAISLTSSHVAASGAAGKWLFLLDSPSLLGEMGA